MIRAGIISLMLASSAAAQSPAFCAPHDLATARLSERYGETLMASGIRPNGSVMRIYANERTGSWTITATIPGGLSCVAAAGVGFKSGLDGQAL